MKNNYVSMQKILICIVLFFILITKTFAENKPPVIYTWHMPFYFEDEEKSPFVLFIKELEKEIGIKFEIKVYSPKLSISYFEQEKDSILFPATNLNLPDTIKLVKSTPVVQKTIHAFVLKDKNIPKTFKDIIGKEVAIVRGYSYPINITDNNDIFLSYTKNARISMQKLHEGSVDVVLNDLAIGKEAVAQANLENISYDETTPFTEIDIFFACHKNKRGKKRIKILSNMIKKIKKEKQLSDFLIK